MLRQAQHDTVIGIDCRFASTKAGLGRYTRELTRALLLRSDPWSYVLFVRGDEGGLGDLPRSSNVQRVTFNAPHYSIQEHLLWPQAIRRSGITLLHVPHFDVPLYSPTPFIATIHDLTLHHYPNQASLLKRTAYRFLMRSTLKRAAHIIAVSEFTRGELSKQYACLRTPLDRAPKERVERPLDSALRASLEESTDHISVIPEGVSPIFHPAGRGQREFIGQEWQLPERYFVYVGNAKEHKNVQTLIDAFEKVCTHYPEPLPTLLLVSHGPEVQRLRLAPGVRILEKIDDMHLRALYTGAVAMVLPSLYEGFGLPCLEAMASWCPVIAANRTSLPEVCGDAALLVEPTVEGLSSAMVNVMHLHSDSMERATMMERGLQRAKEFTWEKTAERTAEVYRDVLNERGMLQ